MNLRGPISQKQFLYVGYTHLEWLLVPPGPRHTTHSYWRWPMKYRTPFIGHMLFIYFYLSPVAFFLFFPYLSLFLCLGVCLTCSCFLILSFFIRSYSLLIMHSYRRWQMKTKSLFTHIILFVSSWLLLSLSVSFLSLYSCLSVLTLLLCPSGQRL